jgi:preprotein translocase subunit SecD
MRSCLFASIVIAAWCPPISCFAGDLINLKIAKAEKFHDPRNALPVINVRVSDSDSHLFADWTSRHVGAKLNVMIDGRVVSEPRLMSPITGGSLQVSGLPEDEIDALIPKLLSGRSTVAIDTPE